MASEIVAQHPGEFAPSVASVVWSMVAEAGKDLRRVHVLPDERDDRALRILAPVGDGDRAGDVHSTTDRVHDEGREEHENEHPETAFSDIPPCVPVAMVVPEEKTRKEESEADHDEGQQHDSHAQTCVQDPEGEYHHRTTVRDE